MIIRRYASSGTTMRGPVAGETGFDLSYVMRETLVSAGSDSPRTTDDSHYTDSTSATVDRVPDVIAAETVPGTFESVPRFESINPSVATVNENGVLTRVADGTVGVIVRTRTLSKRIDVPVIRVGGAMTSTFTGFVAGSLAAHCAAAVDAKIAGKTLAANGNLFSTQDHVAGTYVRNPSFWAAAVDLTCISPWNSAGGVLQAGTLVSPQHLVMAEHYAFGPGTLVRFVTAANVVVTRTVSATVSAGPANASDAYASDVTVARLDSDVPASISFARVPPTTLAADYLPGVANGVPCLCLDQEEKGLVTDLSALTAYASFRAPRDATRLLFHESKVGGDSGNPAFLLVNGLPVLVSTWTFGGSGVGPNYADATLRSQINAAMTTLGGGYQLTSASLAGFAVY